MRLVFIGTNEWIKGMEGIETLLMHSLNSPVSVLSIDAGFGLIIDESNRGVEAFRCPPEELRIKSVIDSQRGHRYSTWQKD